MKIQKFEEIEAWKSARILTKKIYELTNGNIKLNKDFGLKDQLQRASVSIMNNIAEGFERQSRAEFIKFLYYSKGSVGEIRSLLYVILDNKYFSQDEFNEFYDLTNHISNLIGKFIVYLKKC